VQGDGGAAVAMPVRAPGRDNGLLGFPCLSHCSFQLDRSGTLHAMAHYRSHLMVERAYGNYLGLGRLMAYIASQAGLETGELTVTAGYARLDCRGRLSALLADSAAADAA
jgi:thymidylate synthase